jgi:hypothetical protein
LDDNNAFFNLNLSLHVAARVKRENLFSMLNFRRRTPENSYNSESNDVISDNNNNDKGNNNSKVVMSRRQHSASSLPRFVVHISRRKNKLQQLIIILISSTTCLLVLYPPVRLNLFILLCRSITLYLQNCCNSESEAVALWRGTILKEKIPSLDTSSKIDLVVSHCDISIDWIFEWADTLEFRNITIFSKCDKAVNGAPPNSRIIRIDNAGRCDHTYAYYMANYYHESSSNSDYVLFLKDNNNEHRNHYSRHKKLNEMITLSNEFGFACHEETNWVWSDIKSSRDWLGGGLLHPITQISYYHDWNQLQKFKVEEYSRLGRDDNSQFISQYGNNLGDYAKEMMIEPSSETTSSSSSSSTTRIIVPVCYGGNFLFRKKDNLNRSRDFWERIESSLSRGNNIAEGHLMER